jgi:hypothetical protein
MLLPWCFLLAKVLIWASQTASYSLSMLQESLSIITCRKDARLSSWILISHGACMNQFFIKRDEKFVDVATNFAWYSLCMQ